MLLAGYLITLHVEFVHAVSDWLFYYAAVLLAAPLLPTISHYFAHV